MLKRLSHKNLRGLKNNKHKLERVTHIVGDNGTGKTSLLEAVSLLLNGRTFVSTNKKELIKTSEKEMLLMGSVEKASGLATSLSLSVAETKSAHRANDKRISQQKAHLENPLCVVDSNIINVSSGAPSYRRGLIDRAVFHVEPNHAKNHKEFKKCLTQRNRALSKGREQREINSWNEPLSLAGEKISSARQELLSQAKPFFKEMTGEILGAGYGFSFIRGWEEESYLDCLLRNEAKDRILKNTSKGPQKEDFKLLRLNKKTKKYSSHGEEKLASIAFVFSLNMAIEKRKKTLSTMLFDELESGLDNKAFGKLLKIIKTFKNQLLITALVHHSVSKKINGEIIYPEQN